MQYQRPSIAPLCLLLILFAVTAACSSDDNWTDVSELERSDSPAEEVAGDQPPATVTAGRKPSTSSTPLLAATTTPFTVTDTPPTASSQGQALKLIDHGFRQNDDVVSYAFLVTNPNQVLALEGTPYEVSAYTEDGALVTTNAGYLNLIAPGHTTAYANTLSLDDNSKIASIEVQFGEGRAVASEPHPDFAVEEMRMFSDTPVPSLVGIISNPDERVYNDLRLSAVLFDENNRIRGGGFAFVNFVPAGSSTGFRMFVDGLPDVVANRGRVEVYPQLSALSMARASQIPPDATAATLIRSGYGSNGREVGYGFLLENGNDAYDIEGLRYRATAYAADGSVLGTNSGYAPRLSTTQTMGLSGSIFLTAAEPVEHVEIQIANGRFVPPDTTRQPFATEEARFRQGRTVSHVTGFVINPYEQAVTDLFVSAILYDDTGQIIGSGLTFLDEVPTRGRSPVEVRVITAGEPASVELYATLSSLSEFR